MRLFVSTITMFAASVAFAVCAFGQGPTTEPTEFIVDFTDPVSVVNALYVAAQTGDFALLPTLCDPTGENDGDTRELCAMTADSPRAREFVELFAEGGVSGEAVIGGGEAEVPITFGPLGLEEESMSLVLRDGLWYLSSF